VSPPRRSSLFPEGIFGNQYKLRRQRLGPNRHGLSLSISGKGLVSALGANSIKSRQIVNMKTTKVLFLFGLSLSLIFASSPAPGQSAAKAQSFFDWSTKLELTAEQQKLLHLYNNLELETANAAKIQETKEEVERLATKLGPLAVRPARPGELFIFRVGQTGETTILNPSNTNLAFTVSVKGDTESFGSRKASMGRQTYLPPNSTLTVTNLYWTSPSMSESQH
jgi:hypothetical protein